MENMADYLIGAMTMKSEKTSKSIMKTRSVKDSGD